jgi:hypothetical protein
MNNEKIIENLNYIVLMGLIIAQCVIGKWYLVGQSIYLICNVISVTRSIVLHRPKADKIKDFSCTAITIGLILLALR